MYGGSTCLVFLGAWLVELRNWQQRLAHEGWRRANSPDTRSRTFGIAISNVFIQSSISASFRIAAFQPTKLLRGAQRAAMRKLRRSVRSIDQRPQWAVDQRFAALLWAKVQRCLRGHCWSSSAAF